MFDRTGTCYLLGSVICSILRSVYILCTGITAGGTWGLWEGLRRPEGRTTRLRMNSILNGCTRRGPFLGNTAAVLGKRERERRECIFFTFYLFLALIYSPLCSALAHYRGVDDNINSIAAASVTGLLYKSTGNGCHYATSQ